MRNARHDQVITLLTGAGPNVELEVLRQLPSSPAMSSPPLSPVSPTGKSKSELKSSTQVPVKVAQGAPPHKHHSSPSLAAVEPSHRAPPSPSVIDGPQFVRRENGFVVDRISLRHRPGKQIGFSVCGGSDTSCLPFGPDSPGIFISRVSIDL